MRIIPKLGKPQSRGQEPEPVPENGGERGVNRISGRNTPRTRLAQQMADARAEGVQSRAQAGGAKGAKRGGGGVSTPQRQPAAVRRQRAGQQRANERSGMSLYQRVASALRGGGQSWLSGYDVLVAHERAALTTANNVGGGLVGDYRMPGAGFDYDMGALELMNMLNVVAVPAGEMLVYSGDTAPATIWAAEGAALADATTPTIGRVEAGALSVSSVFEFTSSLAKAGGPEAEAEFMRWVDALLYAQSTDNMSVAAS